MAGLQYNFFPTDFFYPRPAQSSTPVGFTPSAALSMQTQKRDDDDDSRQQPGSLIHHGNNKTSVSMKKRGEKLVGRVYMQNRGEQVK
ncbi:hypothetical protein REPUB_Repub02eG0169400 [Reevesia pubescens]